MNFSSPLLRKRFHLNSGTVYGLHRDLIVKLIFRCNMKFKVVVTKGMDFGYIVEVPSLPGCLCQGDTVDEALANIQEAIELYIEDMSPEEIEKAASTNPELHEVAV